MLNPVFVKATDIPDAWNQLIMLILEEGKPFKIDEGSFAGDYRLEFDFVTIQITHPETRPLEPRLPPELGIPDPIEPGYILGDDPNFKGEPYILYLMTDKVKENETYSYGSRLISPFNQIEHVIKKYRTGKIRNNQLCMHIAKPGDMLLNDPPCLQVIDSRVQDNKLHFYTMWRSWDLFGGTPANLAGLQILKEYMAEEIGVDPGETVACSKGLHLYRYVWELAEARRRKDGYVAKFLDEINGK